MVFSGVTKAGLRGAIASPGGRLAPLERTPLAPPPPVNHWVTYGWIVKSWYLYWIRKPFDISRIVILSICCPDLSVVSYVKFDPQYPFQYNWILFFVLNKNNFCFSSLCLYLRIFGHYISFYLGGRGRSTSFRT